MNLRIWTEKIPDKGEDAPPTFLEKEKLAGILAVYDGLGGAGSQSYQLALKDGRPKKFSGAYLASRLAKKFLESYFEDNFPLPLDVSNLESHLKNAFKDFETNLPQNPSKLRSKLIKSLPSTLAGIYYDARASEAGYQVKAFWAGDSRCYLLNQEGLQQLSSDDLKGNPDALENLEEDATISNCLEAKGNFKIHEKSLLIDEPAILITATDGCFHYLPTPAHFEFYLLDSLMQSYFDMDDWQEKLLEVLAPQTGDDLSLSLRALNYQNLNEIKSDLFLRHREVFHNYINPLEEMEAQNKGDGSKKDQLKELRQSLWEVYKVKYYSA